MNASQSDKEPLVLPELPERPLVSILIPSYNQGMFIRACIDSILEQDYRPLRIHVVDGASQDQTVSVLKSYGAIPELDWVSEPDRGVVDAVNKGFERVTGDIVGIQSSDDMYLPGAISKAVDAFRRHHRCGLVYGETVKVDADGNELLRQPTGPFSLYNLFTFRTWIPQPSAFFRSEMLSLCGGWDETIPYAPDTDLWIRMAFRCEVVKIEEFLSQRRMHSEQRDTQGNRIIRDFTKMIDQSPEIANSDRKIRDAAKAARHLIRVRYSHENSSLFRAYHQFRAGQYCPELRDWSKISWLATLSLRKGLSSLKRRIIQQPSRG